MSENAVDTYARSGRHPVNIGHLVMGLAFAGLVGVWALITGDVVDGNDVRWLLPLPWVFAGAVGLLAVMLASRRRTPTDPSLVDTEPPTDPSLVDTETPADPSLVDTETTENTKEIR